MRCRISPPRRAGRAACTGSSSAAAATTPATVSTTSRPSCSWPATGKTSGPARPWLRSFVRRPRDAPPADDIVEETAGRAGHPPGDSRSRRRSRECHPSRSGEGASAVVSLFRPCSEGRWSAAHPPADARNARTFAARQPQLAAPVGGHQPVRADGSFDTRSSIRSLQGTRAPVMALPFIVEYDG